MAESEKLSVFLCHSPADKAAIKDLHDRLLKYSWIDPWLDDEKLLPGHNRNGEISKALEKAHVIIIGLSKDSITKEGRAQAEFKYAQKIALEKLEGAIFIIPLYIEDIKDLDIPSKLKDIQSVDYFPNKRRVIAFEKILKSLKTRADTLGIPNGGGDILTSKERVLEATIEKQINVGKSASLFVWIRRHESKNIISVIGSIDEYVRLDEENVKTKVLEIEFPVENEKILSAEIILRLVAYEFVPSIQQKKINVPPQGDSEVCTFIVTPKQTGELLLNLEVLKDEVSLVNQTLRTTAIEVEKKVDSSLILVTIPVVVFVQTSTSILKSTLKPSKNKYSKENISLTKGVISTAEFPIHEIPFRKNINFTGRKDILDSIHEEFSAVQTRVPIHAIRGMGGIGKTQIAVHYSYEFEKEYDLVYWIRSETDASLTADYEALTQALQLPVKAKAEQSVYVNIVNNWLENTDKKWLLVFDNVESQEKIEKLLPRKGIGQILITSQNPDWKELGEDSQVRPFTSEEASGFLKRRLGEKGLEHADKLNVLLGGLPLALEQACAYMAAHGTPLEIYIRLFEEQQEELWKLEPPPKDYKSTVMTTWEMAFKQIQRSHPAAKQLLNLFAFFGPDDIPISIIKTYSDNLPEELKKAVHNPIELEENLSSIYRYSLAERNGEFISFHRLVQDVIRTQLPKDKAAKWVNIAVQIMKLAFPYDEYDIKTWTNCAQLLPHALAAANYAEKYSIGLDDGAEIYQKTGEYLRGQAEYQRAGEAIERAINIRHEILGADHEKLAASLDYLGEIRQEQANYIEAHSLYNQAFEIFQTEEVSETQQLARNLNNLGRLFLDQGEVEKAKKYNEQALAVRRIVLGENHPETAATLNNIGGMFRLQGEFEISQKYYEEALAINRAVLGKNHPQIAGSLNNFGLLLIDLRKFELARSYYQESLTILRTVLGDNHPSTATVLTNLAGLLEELGDLENTRKYYEESLAIRLTVLGENHPSTANSFHNIGVMLAKQSKYVDAKRYMEKALSICEKVYGPKHHDLITILASLASVMLKLRLFPLARQYAERATKICSEAKVKYRECEDIEKLKKSISLIGGKTTNKNKKHK